MFILDLLTWLAWMAKASKMEENKRYTLISELSNGYCSRIHGEICCFIECVHLEREDKKNVHFESVDIIGRINENP